MNPMSTTSEPVDKSNIDIGGLVGVRCVNRPDSVKELEMLCLSVQRGHKEAQKTQDIVLLSTSCAPCAFLRPSLLLFYSLINNKITRNFMAFGRAKIAKPD